MHILLVSPSAPPKNSPEAMQVGRFLSALDKSIDVTLVTTPIAHGWQWYDASLSLKRAGMNVITASLPMHCLFQRLLANHRLTRIHVPDADFWLPLYIDYVVTRITDIPDVIYSRSVPFSAALLAQRLKRRLNRPWMMHLSDPWSGSPYRTLSSHNAIVDQELEMSCVSDADLITLTTEGQADFYRSRYPDRAKDIMVTPNMMPILDSGLVAQTMAPEHETQGLRLVYTGAMYGSREPSTLLNALHQIHAVMPRLAEQISVDFYGNMAPEIASAIDATPSCTRHGAVSFLDASRAQQSADVLLTIEPSGNHPLFLHFMPSKNLDYMSLRKPILAITPGGSETERLCKRGQGWAVEPGNFTGMSELLVKLASDIGQGMPLLTPPDPVDSDFRAEAVVASVVQKLRSLCETQTTTAIR